MEPGTYVVAVSGGVDSMVLLDILSRQKDIKLIVAHYDHGIRPDSEIDRQLVQEVSRQYKLPFVFHMGKLGPNVSEAAARKARYEFLHKVRKATKANAIVTAHHQDDLIETAILNLLRGTGRKGLSSLGDSAHLRRPLVDTPKETLISYAKKQGIKWREDTTNIDTKYKRNYVREHIVKKLSPTERKRFVKLLSGAKQTNRAIDKRINNYLQLSSADNKLNRQMFIQLSQPVALEVLAAWLRQNGISQFDKKLLSKLVVAGKTLGVGKQADVDAKHVIKLTKQELVLEKRKK